MKDKENYQGREQSYIKHLVLETYLEKLFMIIGQYEQRICYVDSFSGPWQTTDHELSDTSISRSINVMKKCRESLKKAFGKSVVFRALFIEKNPQSYKRLDSYLKQNICEGIQVEARKGEFHQLQSEILKWCGDQDFVFFFIDPTGWKNSIEIPVLMPLLERKRSEFLINFMYDFLNRAVKQDCFQKDMEAIFGESPQISYKSPKDREILLIQQYRKSLKSFNQDDAEKLRTAYVTILDRIKERTKYHLVYLTRHPMGIVKFMETSEKANNVQRIVRLETKMDKREKETGIEDLFGVEVELNYPENVVDTNVVKEYWLNQLDTVPKRFGIEDLADMLEETNWFQSDLQKAFNELLEEGKVANLDAKVKRPKNPVHFNKNEQLIRIQS